MLDPAEVLHVARLARLKLSGEEVERMAGELSSILDHVALISELDLDDVPPTSHVVEVEDGLRADVPGPCLPRDVALSQAPAVQDGGFLVPSPQAG
jgi:aspartyl-tRNA(Asn)/glutamyl-tRNA(Gln) amidotransferase subunit C